MDEHPWHAISETEVRMVLFPLSLANSYLLPKKLLNILKTRTKAVCQYFSKTFIRKK